MLDPIKNRRIGEAEVMEKFGVGPDKVVDVQALAGDSTRQRARACPASASRPRPSSSTAYGDLDTLLARAGEIKQPKRREALMANAEHGAPQPATWCGCKRRRAAAGAARYISQGESPIPAACCPFWS